MVQAVKNASVAIVSNGFLQKIRKIGKIVTLRPLGCRNLLVDSKV